MVKLEPILDRIWRKLEIPAIPLCTKHQGSFFIMSKNGYIRTKSFGPHDSFNFTVDSNSLLKSLIKSENGEAIPENIVAKLAFSFTWDEESTIPITIGFYLNDGASEHIENDLDSNKPSHEAYLIGAKQALLIGLQMERENQRRIKILDITKKLYSSMEVNHILDVVYTSIIDLFPQGDLQIYLSHDYETSIPVQKLSFIGQESDNNIKAFLSGKPYICNANQNRGLSTSFPLKGKQGTYGVIQFVHPQEHVSQDIVDTITLIAEASGIALETAILYQQSQHLISQLRLINETTQLLNKTLNFDENINHLIGEIEKIFKPEGIHLLTYLGGEQAYEIIKSTGNQLPIKLVPVERFQIIKKVHETKEAMLIPDTSKEIADNTGDPLFAELCQSLIAVPMMHNLQIQGLLIITHSKPYYFSFEDYRLIQTLVNQASLAIVNSRLHQELNKMVITDNLTRLHARSYLDQEIVISQNQDLKGAFILIDIDNFKLVNDTYGHQTGDDVLIQVANIIKSSIRSDDIAARWGGEELAIYLPNATTETATQVAERIRTRVSRETSPQVTISIGISSWEEEDLQKGLDLLFQKADQLLYIAKSTGKNQVMASHH